MLTPVDIHNKEFGRSFRGYNEDEIDDFLDQVVNDYEKLYRENGQLKDDLERKEKDLTQYHQLEKNLQDTLLVAQRTAEEVTRAAKSQAEEMRANAQQACANMRAQAEMDAQKRIEEASHQVREIVAEYDRLVREKRQFITKIRSLMQVTAVLNTPAEPKTLFYRDQNVAVIYLPRDLEKNRYSADAGSIGVFYDNTNTAQTADIKAALNELIAIDNQQAAGNQSQSGISLHERNLFNPAASTSNGETQGFLFFFSSMRVWERGAAVTLACGTGSCATLTAAVLNGLTDRKAEIELDGGKLIVEWAENGRLYMTGPAEQVFAGSFEY